MALDARALFSLPCCIQEKAVCGDIPLSEQAASALDASEVYAVQGTGDIVREDVIEYIRGDKEVSFIENQAIKFFSGQSSPLGVISASLYGLTAYDFESKRADMINGLRDSAKQQLEGLGGGDGRPVSINADGSVDVVGGAL